MKVAKLQIKNFLSIGMAELAPGKVTQICGLNNQGKSSILKALEVAVKGSTDGALVKRGETEAEIIVEFDDQTVINRKIKSDGKQKLSVKKGEFAAQQPQTMLDGLFGNGSFNPLDLLDPKRRTEILLSAIPIRLTQAELVDLAGPCPMELPEVDLNQHGLRALEQAHKFMYAFRANASREAKGKTETAKVKRAELPDLPEPSDDRRTPAQIQNDITSVRAMITRESEKATARESHNRHVQNASAELSQIEGSLRRLDDEILRLTEQLKARQGEREKVETNRKIKAKQVSDMMNAPQAAGPDQEKIAAWNKAIQDDMAEIQRRTQIQTITEKHEHVKTLEKIANDANEFAGKLGDVVTRLAEAPEKLMAKATLPIAGLTYHDGEFYFEETKIEHLSTSAAMRLAIAVARTVAGPSKLICLDGAEALDLETYEALRAATAEDDFQYFITRVGAPFPGWVDAGEGAIEMHQGEARAAQ